MRRMTVTRRDLCALFERHGCGTIEEWPRGGAVLFSQRPKDRRASDRRWHESLCQRVVAFHVGKQHDGLFDGTTERCLGYGSYSEGGAVKEVGRCTVVDADGDKIFDDTK